MGKRFVARDQQVKKFLTAAGRHETVTDELLDTYRPVVSAAGRPGTLRWRATKHLVSQGVVPTREQVDAEVLRRRERTAQLRVDAEEHAEAARDYVSGVRRDTGAGPTWTELKRHLGWTHAAGSAKVRHLIHHGHLIDSGEYRSLDVPHSTL